MSAQTSRTRQSIAYGRECIVVDVLHLERKTMEIAVHPDRRVVVKAPLGSDLEDVIRRVRKRAGWIKRQMLYFEQFEPRTPPRRYVGGESHLYLGRKYRLRISRAETCRVLLKNGRFYIESPRTSREQTRKLLEAWYHQKASVCFPDVLQICWKQFKRHGIAKPELKIRRMKTRWGSMSRNGGLTLNLDLIKAPKQCIEYVVMHELCHLIHHHHGREFYQLLEESMPDWAQRKHKLELSL